LTISRIDLDGAGSPAGLVTRILQLEPNLSIPVPIEQLCQQLDITRIGELDTEGFEAALVTDEHKSAGAILIASERSRQRRRFSIAHELGHFLIPSHFPGPSERSLCSAEHLGIHDMKEQDRRRRMEAEADRFAALLLMPPPVLRAELKAIQRPDVSDVVRLAKLFDVSKDAMARAYADYTREAVAIAVIRNGCVLRTYRNAANFPALAVWRGQPVPSGSLAGTTFQPGQVSNIEECEPGLWVREPDDQTVEALTEQVLGQREGFSLLMIVAELRDEEDFEARQHW
jgi:Zn-dependent peptidase ImmA (M78 family)